MKNILLTGASGFLGQHFLHTLLEQHSDDDIHIVALHHSKPELATALSPFGARCVVVQLDLCDASTVAEWFAAGAARSFDYCVHTAALSSPKACAEDPTKAVAINVPRSFFKHLRQHHPNCHIIALSTDQVYSGTQPQGSMYTEDNDDTAVGPCNEYARTKRQLEEFLLQEQQPSYGATTILRSSILLGPPPTYCSTHSTFLDFCASRATTPTTYWTNEIRSVMAVADVCAILYALLVTTTTAPTATPNASSVTVYNMGGPQPVSRHDMARAVLTTAKGLRAAQDVDRLAIAAVKPAEDTTSPLQIAMDSSKLRAALPQLPPFRTLEDMVLLTLGEHNSSGGALENCRC